MRLCEVQRAPAAALPAPKMRTRTGATQLPLEMDREVVQDATTEGPEALALQVESAERTKKDR